MGITTATDTHYDQNVEDWEMIERMFSGDDVRDVLVRGAYEAKRSFHRRRNRADWKPLTRDLTQRLTGELFTRAGEVARETVVSDEYLSSVGPDDESYEIQLISLVDAAIAYQEVWAIMDPSRGLRIVEPQYVPRATPNAVTVLGNYTPPRSIDQDEQSVKAWTVYYSDHWEVWVKDQGDDDKEEKEVGRGDYYEGEGSFSFNDGPPAYRVRLPWRVPFGKSVARAHRALYRMESKFDEALTNALCGLLQLATGGDDEIRDKIEKALDEGALGIPYSDEHGEHKPLNVGTEGLGPGADTLDRKRRELYRSGYQSLDDASRRMSATEADHRKRSGAAAALSQLAGTIQSAEESILPMIAEAEDVTRDEDELEASVDWPVDYSNAFDGDDEALVQDIFGSLSMPVDVDTATEAIAARVESAGISVDTPDEDGRTRKDKIREAVRTARDREAQSTSLLG